MKNVTRVMKVTVLEKTDKNGDETSYKILGTMPASTFDEFKVDGEVKEVYAKFIMPVEDFMNQASFTVQEDSVSLFDESGGEK